MFWNKPALPQLEVGEHSAIVESYELIEAKTNEQKQIPAYVRINLKLSDRVINDNRFEQGFEIFKSQILKQLDLKAFESGIELLDELLNKEIKIFISYTKAVNNSGEIKTYRNISYLPPIETTPANETEEAPI